MTVAAVILSATAEGALADTLGQPRVRRLADLAWSGGALPIVVLAPDPDGAVAAALAAPRRSTAPLPRPRPARVGQMVRGAELAMAEVSDTTAVLLWPARMTWVGPETITSLIEAHGTDTATTMLRPAWHGEPGWPVLVPTSHLDALCARSRRTGCRPTSSTTSSPRVPSRIDRDRRPGRRSTTPTPRRRDLPPYEGPPDPPAGHTHEWGADVAAEAGLPRIGLRPAVSRSAGGRPRLAPRARRGARASGTVAAAIPPIDERDAEQLARRRRLAEQDHRQAHRHDRLGEQDDRGDDRRQPRQRDRDEQVAGRLRGDPEQRQPEQARRAAASGRGRRSTVADRRTTQHRRPTVAIATGPGRAARVAAAAPDEQQVAGVADRGRDARG